MKDRLQGYVTTYPARFPYIYARDWVLEPTDAERQAEARRQMHDMIRTEDRASEKSGPRPRRSIVQRLLGL